MDKLHNRAKRELDINTKELMLIIKYLKDEKFFVEGSKLIKQELLKNSYREAIYQFINQHPGINFLAIKRFVFNYVKGIQPNELDREGAGSSGQLLWHIEILLKFKCIKKLDFKNYSLFVLDEVDPETGVFYFLLRDNINRKIFRYLIQNHSITQSEIPELTGLSKGTISHRIRALKESNIIITEKLGRTKEIHINPNNKEQLLKIYYDLESKLIKMKKVNKIPIEKPESKLEIKESKDKEEDKEIIHEKTKSQIESISKEINKDIVQEEVSRPEKKDKEKPKRERQKIT